MTSTRLSSRTAAGTLAGLMGASLLLPALTAKAAPLEFDCYSRTTQELLVKAAYDMSNGGMACIKSSAATTAAAAAPAEAVVTETASDSTETSEGNSNEASLPAEDPAAEGSTNANGETGRAPGLGAVIVGGIVNSLMDKLLNRLVPGAAGEAAAVDGTAIDDGAEVLDAAVVDPSAMDGGVGAAEAPIEQQAGGSRPIPNFGSLVNKTSTIPGLVKQALVKPMPRPQLPNWFGTKRPSFKPLPGPLVNKPVFTRPSFTRPNVASKTVAAPLPNFSNLRTVR